MRRAFVVMAALAATMLAATPAMAGAEVGRDAVVEALLTRVVEASRALHYAGTVSVVSFGERGPQVTEVDLTRGDGSVRLSQGSGWEFGRVAGEGFLRSADTLLRVGGVERLPTDLDRLWAKYAVRRDGVVDLDTGPAEALVVTERSSGVRREVLYVDLETGLVVRRETFSLTGDPVRVVAFTTFDVGAGEVLVPASDGLEVQEHEFAPTEIDALVAAGFEVAPELPRGYRLLEAVEVQHAQTPTLHLLYGDGLYTLSVFQQPGRLAEAAVRGAARLTTPDGGTVWRWPGSEPRRVVWSGDGSTYTALTDAPVDELVDVLAGLPTDAAPSILDRLTRGAARVGRWLWPTELHGAE